MSSKIEWTNETWNPVAGCQRVSPGCQNCYAERMAFRLEQMGQAPYKGLTKQVGKTKDIQWTGEVRCLPERLMEPTKWKKPRRIFVNSMSDLFHEDVPFEFIASVFGVMAVTPQHTYQILTKRPQQALKWFKWLDDESLSSDPLLQADEMRIMKCAVHAEAETESFDRPSNYFERIFAQKPQWPLRNVWLGVSVEDQKTADERVPLLLQCPAAVRFVSYEPALENVQWFDVKLLNSCREVEYNWLTGHVNYWDPSGDSVGVNVHLGSETRTKLDWIIAGGESGPGARPSNLQWFRNTRDACQRAGVPFFFKQWGAWMPSPEDETKMIHVGKKAAGRLLDGREWDEYPAKQVIK